MFQFRVVRWLCLVSTFQLLFSCNFGSVKTPSGEETKLGCFFGSTSTDKTNLVDSSFGENSEVRINHNGQPTKMSGYARTSDCKLILGFDLTGGNYALVRYKRDLQIDTTFGVDGWQVSSYADGTGTNLRGKFSIDKDDNIFLAFESSHSGTGKDFVVIKHKKDGERDTNFGTGGVAVHHISDERIGGVIPLPDGKLIAHGQVAGYGAAAIRMNSDGSRDMSFGTSGVLTMSPTTTAATYNHLIGSDGVYLVGTVEQAVKGYSCLVIKLSLEGSLASSFGTNGTLTWDANPSIEEFDACYRSKLDNSGNLFVFAESENDGAVLKLTKDGQLDTSFNSTGFHYFSVDSTQNQSRNAAILDDGRILVQTTAGNYNDIGFALFKANGELDTSLKAPGDALEFSQPEAGKLVLDLGGQEGIDSTDIFTVNNQVYILISTNESGVYETVIKRLNI